MKKIQSKKVKEEIKKEEEERINEFSYFIKNNPGTTLDEIYDNCNFIDDYEFLKTMTTLFEEYDIISDSGCFFPNEASWLKMRKKSLC
jgi:hypothetical protein